MGNFSGHHHSDKSRALLARRAVATWQNPRVRAERCAAIARSWEARRRAMLDAATDPVPADVDDFPEDADDAA